jgi:hypothetical protein
MRRLFVSLTALCFFGALAGCDHTVGICDCVGPGDACVYGHGPGNPITIVDWRALAAAHHPPAPEGAPMPKAETKEPEIAPAPEKIPAPDDKGKEGEQEK